MASHDHHFEAIDETLLEPNWLVDLGECDDIGVTESQLPSV